MRRVLVHLAVAWLSAPLLRAEISIQIETDPVSGVRVDVVSPFDVTPPVGFLPCAVTIENHSGSNGTWDFSLTTRRQYSTGTIEQFSQRLAVPDGGRSRFDLLVPIVPRPQSENGGTPQMGAVSGRGVVQPSFSISGVIGPSSQTVFVAMSHVLATPSWAALRDYFDKEKHVSLAGSAVNVETLGADWRAWAGIDCLWITPAEYDALTPGPRRAMRDWLMQGGTVFFCVDGQDRVPVEYRPEDGGNIRRVGLGSARVFQWNSTAPPVDRVARAISDLPRGLGELLSFNYRPMSPIILRAGELRLNVALLSVFVALFAVAVGPLNILWLARAGRRHRLFWTTPLISLAASVILVGVIILQDGFGGSGGRVLLTYLIPDEPRAVLMQEQASRTGVLLSRNFQVPEHAMLAPITVGGREHDSRMLRVSGDTYSGDWFTSRAIQAQYLQTIVPTRESIEVVNTDATAGGAAPEILSTISAPLTTLYYIDSAGRQWKGEQVIAGSRVTLEPAPDANIRAEISKAVQPGAAIERALESADNREGAFYAIAEEGNFLPTLPSIRWRNDSAIYIGEAKRASVP
jgi:hypothetical protein